MTFDDLLLFLEGDMRMSHVYQPLMVRTLLDHGGETSTDEIATALLTEDRSQREYYSEIVKSMVGRVLRNHSVVSRDGPTWRLADFETFTPEQRTALRAACERRLTDYVAKRGDAIWEHRRRSHGYISGTLRYDILKAAKFRCELCGVSAEVRAFEVDHIVPRNRGGSDDRTNLQSLCYQCNAMKRDRDATDFRAVRAAYEHRDRLPILSSGARTSDRHERTSIRDLGRLPVTRFHALVLPWRHAPDFFDLGIPEVRACHGLLAAVRRRVLGDDATVRGFNVGLNARVEAGQTAAHFHFHLIPRRSGDVPTNEVGAQCDARQG